MNQRQKSVIGPVAPDQGSSLQVTEIDHPATQSVKRKAMGVRAPIRLLPCHLVHEPLPLHALGDASSMIVVLEGVLMYLDENDVRSLLRRILVLPALRLRMLASFMVSPSDVSIGFEPHRPMVDWWLRMVREPFRSALRPGHAETFFGSISSERHCWRVTAHADATVLAALGRGNPIARGEEVFECERVALPEGLSPSE